MTPILTFGQRQQAMRGLPFYGPGDFNFVASRNNFSNGISIKLLPLADLSRPQDVEIDEFDQELKALNNAFKVGSRLGGIKINSTYSDKNGNPEHIIGRFESFKIDRKHGTIRAFIQDATTLKSIEVYPETLSRISESKSYLAKTFLEFLI
jgi:hypothetical protein